MVTKRNKATNHRFFTAQSGSLAFYALALFSLLVTAPLRAELTSLDNIVVIVNEDVVMQSELKALTARYLKSNPQLQAESKEALTKKALDKLILDRLQINIGEKVGISISDEEVNVALEQTAQRQNMSLEQLLQAAMNDGLDPERLRKQFHQEMIINKVQQGMVRRRIEITEQEVTNYLNSEEGQLMTSPEVDFGHILLLPGAKAPQYTKHTLKKADRMRKRILKRGNFRQLAAAMSTGPHSAEGGDLGWRYAIQLPPLFRESLAKLQPGEVSPPLLSDAGIHLLKLYDRRGGGEKFVAQTEMRHILIKPNIIRDETEAKKFSAALRKRITDGESFAALAREFSEDPGTALKGGDLGWSSAGQYVPIFERTASQLDIDELSQPVLSQFGWHIIEVTGRRKEDLSEEFLTNQVRNIIGKRKYAEELPLWLQEIRSEAYIDIKI